MPSHIDQRRCRNYAGEGHQLWVMNIPELKHRAKRYAEDEAPSADLASGVKHGRLCHDRRSIRLHRSSLRRGSGNSIY